MQSIVRTHRTGRMDRIGMFCALLLPVGMPGWRHAQTVPDRSASLAPDRFVPATEQASLPKSAAASYPRAHLAAVLSEGFEDAKRPPKVRTFPVPRAMTARDLRMPAAGPVFIGGGIR